MRTQNPLAWLYILAAVLLLSPSISFAQSAQYLLPPDKHSIGQPSDFSEGLARVHIVYQGFGFINTQGEQEFKQTFERAGNFYSGMAWVMKKTKGEKRYGYINKKGQLAIPYIYDRALNFSDDRALVNKQAKWLVIDRLGHVVTDNPHLFVPEDWNNYAADPSYNLIASPGFHDKRMLVKQNDKYGYIDVNGKLVIPFKYAIAENFSEGAAVVKVERPGEPQPYQWQIIDTTGQVLFTFQKDQYPEFDAGFSNGLLLFRDRSTSKSRYGFINQHGQVIIEARTYHNHPFLFSDGVAIFQFSGKQRCNKDGYMLIINNKAEVVSKVPFCGQYGCMYDSNRQFHEGLLAVRVSVKDQGMLWGFIDKKGQFAIAPQYSSARDFHDGRAVVWTEDGRLNYLINPLKN